MAAIISRITLIADILQVERMVPAQRRSVYHFGGLITRHLPTREDL